MLVAKRMDSKRKDLLRKLHKPEDYNHFLSSVEDYLFELAGINGWDAVSKLFMLNFKHFKKEDVVAYEAGLVKKGLIEGGGGCDVHWRRRQSYFVSITAQGQNQAHPPEDQDVAGKITQIYVDSCYEVAAANGAGF